MSTSDEKERQYERMEREYRDYLESLDTLQPLPKPEYDPETFQDFRSWQQARVARKDKEELF